MVWHAANFNYVLHAVSNLKLLVFKEQSLRFGYLLNTYSVHRAQQVSGAT